MGQSLSLLKLPRAPRGGCSLRGRGSLADPPGGGWVSHHSRARCLLLCLTDGTSEAQSRASTDFHRRCRMSTCTLRSHSINRSGTHARLSRLGKITMRDGVQACGHFLECLLLIQRGESGKQRPIKGVEGRLALRRESEAPGERHSPCERLQRNY